MSFGFLIITFGLVFVPMEKSFFLKIAFMKTLCISVFCVFCAISGFSQSRFFVNLNGGIDMNSNKYYAPNDYEKFENGKTDFNTGLDLGYRFSDITRFRLQFRFLEYSFGQRPLTAGDIRESEMTLKSLGFTPRFDIRVWSFKDLELFLSPGLKLEYALESDQESLRSDGSVSDMNYIKTDYSDKMSGFSGGAVIKYNFTKHLGATLSPDYTLFFKKLYEKNDASLRRFSLNAGVEWRF